MKNKVGIMTLHIGDNFGALLQCYALRTYLNHLPNIEGNIINYDPGRIFTEYDDPAIQCVYKKRLEKFNSFNRDYNGINDPVYTCEEELSKLKYDYYITGSDQVWNTSFSFSKEAYFLNFVSDNAKKISYAASIAAPVNSGKLNVEWFEKNIPQFDNISIRESTHVEFLKRFTNKDVQVTVDPTMLLDAEDYDELCKGIKAPYDDYLVLYFLKHDNSAPLLIEFANMISRMFDLKVVYSFADVYENTFKNESCSFLDYDPREFVNLIKNAKVVVTNSFHGTVFSIKYHVPFFTYIVSHMGSRVTDLLRDTGLEDRIVRGYRPLTMDMLDVDFSQADLVIKDKQRYSMEFLNSALGIRNYDE